MKDVYNLSKNCGACLDPSILWLQAFPNQMTYLSYSVQVHHSTVLGPSTNKVISVLGGKHAEGKVGRWVRAEGHLNKNKCKKCGRCTGLDRARTLQSTSVKQLNERGEDRGENTGVEKTNSQKGGKEGKEEKQVSTACHWPPGVNNPSQIDLPARPSRAF